MPGSQTVPDDVFVPPDWSGEATEHLERLRVYAEAKIEQELMPVAALSGVTPRHDEVWLAENFR